MKHRYLKNVTTLKYDQEACTGCGRCAEVCPHQVFRMDGVKAFLTDKDSCMECGACAKNCPFQAISVRPGVGCAYAIIWGWLKGGEPSCCEDSSCCGSS
jgi:NAD-dependent dihydropyrimidine dehydrogenase PreA subunit